MSDLIDKKALYNRFADLEAVALEQVKKYVPHEDLTEWRIWSTILAERTAYKHDVFDAPVVDAELVRYGHWCFEELPDGYYHWECSECKKWFKEDSMSIDEEWKYCPNCGTKMDEEGS